MISQKQPLTILNVSQNYHIRGGSDRIFFATSQVLEAAGERVIPFAAQHPENESTAWSPYFPLAANFENPGPRDLLRFLYSRPAAHAIERIIAERHPDIAHLHIYYGKLTGSILSPLRRVGIPIVQTLHEYKLICPVYTLVSNGEICEACAGSQFWRAIPRRCNRGSLRRSLLSSAETYVSRFLGSVKNIDHFIAVSDFVRTKMIQYGIPPDKISTVHNFVDVSGIEPNLQEGNYALYFGRLERLKGLFTLVEAFAPLTHIPLYIVGNGSDAAELESWISQRRLTHIHLLGFKHGRELENLIRRSRFTVMPSEWYEPLATTVLESWTHGRTVVASNIGGFGEMIDDGTNGFLLPAGDVAALREKADWLFSRPEVACAMGIEGRRKVEDRFNPRRYYEDLMKVYRRVLS